MISIVAEGFGLGLATGTYCLGACAPLLLPYMFSESRTGWKANALLLTEFLAGRALAYLIYAIIASWAAALIRPALPPIVIKISLGFSGALLLVYALAKNFPSIAICRYIEKAPAMKRFPFVIGFLVGINICPPFIAGTARLISIHQIGFGIIYFGAFFLGTSLYLLPMLLAAPWLRSTRLASAARICSILSGLWLLAQSLT